MRLQNFRLFSPAAGVGNPGPSKLHQLSLISLLSTLPLFCAPPDYSFTYRFTTYPGETTDNLTVFTATGPTPQLNNKQMGCISWQLLYNTNGLSGVSVNLQSAPSGQGNGVGSWSTFSGTNATGSASLPMTTTNASSAFVSWGYFPWMRVNVATLTGTGAIDIQLSCWKSVIYAGGLGGGGSTSSSNLNFPCISVSGSSTAYTCSSGASLAAYADNQVFLWQPDVESGHHPTLNVDSLGAKTIFYNESFPNDGAFVSGFLYPLKYDSNDSAFLVVDQLGTLTFANSCNFGEIAQGGSNQNQITCSQNSSNYSFSYNATGENVNLAGLAGSNLTATAVSGCSATIGTGSTNIAGFYTAATQASPCVVTLTMGSSTIYPHGPICQVNDLTTLTDIQSQTGYTTTTATISGITVANDKIAYLCIGF